MPEARRAPLLRVNHPGERLDQLAVRLARSDRIAFAEIFQQMHEPLLRYAYRFTKDEPLALDVVQDVFVKLWEKRSSLEISTSFKALLYTMTRNKSLNENRNRSRRASQLTPDITERMGVLDPNAGELYEARQLEEHFRNWIQMLPPRRAEAFVLSRYHHLSHQEIGAIMGLSRRTVDTHIVHALRFLRNRYEALNNNGIYP